MPPRFGSRAGLLIEAGVSDYVLKDHLIVPEDLNLITVWGHAHQVCTAMQATATLPDGTKLPLFKIDEWDFDWQGQYAFKEPVRLPKGTRIDTEIHYDNSAANPNNPNHPPRHIRWGEQSDDEMGSLIFQCVASEKSRESSLAAGLRKQLSQSVDRFAEQRRAMLRVAMVMLLDTNKDDRLTLAETPQEYRRAFGLLDRNKDEVVDIEEVKKFGGFLDRRLKR